MKKLSLGLQTFSKIIENNCIYIDKTQYIYDLIQENYVFFSRPRRFGKSLLCSTLKELFSGKRKLFQNLWIDKNINYEWPVHPIIHIDMSQVAKTSPEILNASLMRQLSDIAELYEIKNLEHSTPGEMLKKLTVLLFEKFGSKNGVVIIIDEYDKPILDNIGKQNIALEIRDVLKNFYEYIKGLDAYLRFVFMTGVTQFSKTSIFSGLNQFNNISMEPKFAHLVGYTKDEIDLYFQEHLQKIADEKMMPAQEGVDKLKTTLHLWYNGYRFWKDQQLRTRELAGHEPARLYSPFSVLNFLHKSDFRNYWFESGTPTFLIKILEQKQYPVELFENLKADENELLSFDMDRIPLAPLLFQTGYATIKNYDALKELYTLEMPNYEVRDSLLKNVLLVITQQSSATINTELIELRLALEQEDLETFIDKIKKFYATVPYTIAIDKEKYYQTIFFLLLQLINLKPEVERTTNIGRIDLLVQTNTVLYLFEFKLNGSAEKAIQQILNKKYYEAYQECGKKIKLVGVNFSSDAKNVTEYLSQELA
jgi:hypothetical protein